MLSADRAELFRLPEEIPALYWLQLWQTARNNFRTLALFVAAGIAIGLAIAAFQTPLYQATASIEVQGITDNFLKAQDGNPNAGADAELMDLQTQVRIIQSGSVVAGVADALARNQPPAQQRAIREAAASLAVYVAGQTRIIQITSSSSDPRAAARFVNTLAASFIDQHMEARWQGAQRGAEKLRTALDAMRGQLEQSESALQEYAHGSGLLLSADRNVAAEDKLRLLQTELAQAAADRIVKQSRFDAVSAADSPAIMNNPAIQDAESKLTDLRRQLAELGTTYTAGYSKVRRLQAQIEPLESAIRKEMLGTRDRARSEYAEARHRETLLQSAYSAQVEAVAREAESKVHYDALRREVDSSRNLYDTMLARVKEAEIASTMRASNVRVLDPARPASEPFQPRRRRMALLGSIAGLFLGFGFSVTRRQADHSVQSPGELARVLQAREFGAIPSAREAGSGVFERVEDHGLFAESFRSLRASLLLDRPSANVKTLVISSVDAGEGKTTLALHLADAFAQIGMRVLLIDGDLRRPRLHVALNTPNAFGLSDLLTAPSPLDDTIDRAILPTPRPHLSLLPAGAITLGSPDFLYSPNLAAITAHARNNFDIVLIDSPPMVQIPDARILGRAADAVLIVVRARKTARELLVTVRQRLLEDQTPIIGCVLNDWNPKQSPGYYGQSRQTPRSAGWFSVARLLPVKTPLSSHRPA